MATKPAIAPEQKPLKEINLDLLRIIFVITQLNPPILADKFVLITAFTARELIP